MSSMRSTSTCRYFCRNSAVWLFLIAMMNSFVNFSLETYTMFASGFAASTRWPIACMRCVLPRPTPP